MFLTMKVTSTSAITCLASAPGDSKSFGHALAISDNYLAVGDPEANRVVIYNRNSGGKWLRTREIVPAKGSAAHKIGAGFGYDLALDKTILIVGAYTEKHQPSHPERFQYTNQLGVSYSGGVYKIELNKATEVQRVDVVAGGEISGFSVSAHNGKIAFGIRREEKPGRWVGKVQLTSSSNIEYIMPPTDSAAQNFGVDAEIKNDFLLIGAPFDGTGAAWLFDLKTPKSKPQRLAVTNAHIGSTVAISDQFAVVGAVGGLAYAVSPKTLIKEIKDGSTTILEGSGELSLDRKTLARMRRRSNDGEQQALLEIFNLDDIAAPRLVKKRGGIDRALIQNSFLTTVQKTASGIKLCIE